MVQIGAGLNEGTTRLGHLGAVDGDIAVDEDVARFTEATAFEHRRPEQAVEVDDILTDKVIQLGVALFTPVGIEAQVAALVAQVLERAHVAYRRIQPDVEVFTRRIGDLKAKVGGVAGDVPLLQAGLEPLLHLVGHLLL